MRRLLLLLVAALPLFGKSLHWTSFDVEARLDADGRLHVVERHRMVIDGDWNGAERTFEVRRGQRLTLHALTRQDGSRVIPLVKGDLDEVDHYDWWNGDTLRWRSRLPSDPPFENKPLDYAIDYTWSNVLVSQDAKTFRLSHDFGLPQREAVIQRASLRLTIDPIWGVASPVVIEQQNLAPGESLIVNQTLHYGGTATPAGIEKPIAPVLQYGAIALFLAGALLLAVRFAAGERAAGRFEPVSAKLDPSVLDHPAEVAGAMWDQGIGAAEVAAVLARMTQEHKLTSRVEADNLHLELEVDRRTLRGHERELISGLFFDGRNATDTKQVKEHYRRQGFDPAGLIREGIEKQLELLPQWNVRLKRFSGARDALLIASSIALVVAAVWFDRDAIPAGIAVGFLSAFFSLIAAASAHHFSKSVTNLDLGFTVTGILAAVASAPFLVTALGARRFAIDAPVLFALALAMLALLNLILDLLKIRDSREKIAYRKNAARTRLFFATELEKQNPDLRDEWFPYVLAFGLGKNVDRWFQSWGASGSRASSSSWSSSTSSSSSGSSSAGWSGGGGAFGGAGAAGTWAVAAGTIASGVSAPSSSSGGGGGGSSSGGGGGGGW